MTRSRFYIILIICLIISNILLLGFIYIIKSDSGSKPNFGPKDLIIERLHFDKNQIKKFETLIPPHKKAIRKNSDLIHSAKKELYKEISLPTAEQNTDSLLHAIASSQKEIELLHFNHFRDIKGLCNEDQLDDFAKLSKNLSNLFAARGCKPTK